MSPSISLGSKFYGSRVLCEAWMTLLSETAIFFLDGPRVSSPDFFASFVVMEIPVALVCNIPMAERYWSHMPMMCGMYCVLKVFIVEMGYLKCTMCPLVWWMVGGGVWTGEVVPHLRWLVWINVAIMLVLASHARNAFMLILSIYFNACLCVRYALLRLIFLHTG